MIIAMGLDPASFKNLGLCIAEVYLDKIEIIYKTTIVFNVDKETKDRRFVELEKVMQECIDKYEVKEVAFERTQFGKPFVMSQIYETIGVIKLVAVRNGLNITEISPSTAKKLITGSGKATKVQMKKAVMDKFLLEKKTISSEHEADAVGICYAFSKIEK